MRGIYFGRFQPCHLQHLDQVDKILESYQGLDLSIGVADWKGELSKQNFLTGEEACDIFRISLADRGHDSVNVIGVELRPGLDLVESIAQPVNNLGIEYIFSGSDKTLKASRDLKEMFDMPHLEIVDLNDTGNGVRASDLREWMLEGNMQWPEFMTPNGAKYLLDRPDIFVRQWTLGEGQKRPWVEGNGRGWFGPSTERR